ncbi:unnamed protein product [Prorocentrum cordatum]|uniref:Uncharacterized protein n=1 Tax=Prorocentrum cordatum TaxID=2364126 RepID=A0ABN9V2V5_9DINO|nr:unnamed protein product [Polarella glacialis]
MAEEDTQQNVLHFVLPVLAVIVTLAAPFITVSALGRGPVIEELKAAAGRRLSLLSLGITLLSPVFFISGYDQTALFQYSTYSMLLSQANIIADRLGKRRLLPPLLAWHCVNLLNLIGGNFSSLLQIYSTGSAGLIMTVFGISQRAGGDCADGSPLHGATVDYCSDGWIAVQLLAGFLYVLLHVLAFFTVALRAVGLYGGEDEAPVDGVFREREAPQPLLG